MHQIRNSALLLLFVCAFFASSCTGKKAPSGKPTTSTANEPVALPPLPNAGFYNNADSAPLLQILNASKSSLKIAIYEMSDPKVLQAIRGALSRGVKIQVLKEPKPIGESCNLFEPSDSPETDKGASCQDQRKLMNEIKASSGEFVAFNKNLFCPIQELPCVMHGKMVIADQKAALLSTGNFNASNLCNLDLPESEKPKKCNRDYSLVLEEKNQLELLSAVFDGDLKNEVYDLKKVIDASAANKEVTVSPFSTEPLVQLIQAAKTSIKIQNQYMKDEILNKTLVEAAARGVKIELTIASACSFGKPKDLERQKLGVIYGPLLDAGISIRAFSTRNKIKDRSGYMHAKAIVVDGEKAWVGSVNGSASGTSNNREFGLIFSEKDRVQSLETIMNQDFSASETWAESLDCVHDEIPELDAQNGPGAHSVP